MKGAKAAALACVLATAACSQGPKLDLGSNDGSTSPTASGASIVGTWSGYAELQTFGDGSDVMTLTIAQAADASYSGTIAFGTRPPPPAPTDPMTGYPPFLYEEEEAGEPPVADIGSSGFAYTLQSILFDGERLRFAYDLDEMWKAWCELQQPIYWPGDPTPPGAVPTAPGAGYFCAPVIDGALRSFQPNKASLVALADGGTGTIDPIRYGLCGALSPAALGILNTEGPIDVCPCTATACAVATQVEGFDMRLSGDQLDGSGQPGNVHFTRH